MPEFHRLALQLSPWSSKDTPGYPIQFDNSIALSQEGVNDFALDLSIPAVVFYSLLGSTDMPATMRQPVLC